MEPNSVVVGEAEIHKEVAVNVPTLNMDETKATEMVPSEGYVEEIRKDGAKSFRCKQCDKTIKTEKGVKTHIAHVHKDQALKRVATKDTNDDEGVKRKKEISDEFEFSDESLRMDMMCDQVLSSSPVHQVRGVDDQNDSYLEKLMDPEADNEDKEVSELNPDQDHDFLIDEDVTDSAILKIKVLSLEADLRKKVDELLETKSALDAKTDEVLLKQEAAESALARVNLLEEKNAKYCRTVKTLVADAKQKEEDLKACKKVIAEKDKLLKKAAAEKKLLAKRVEEIENSVTSENASLSDQHRATNEKLKVKSKELKEAQNDNKKTIENEKGMQAIYNEKNRKISELELALATTKSLLDYAKEISNNKEVAKEAVEKVKEASPPKLKRCKFENTGACNRKDSCKFVHPVTVCQGFSRFGSCPKEGKCEERHPRSVCISWRNTGYCEEGDACRNRLILVVFHLALLIQNQ